MASAGRSITYNFLNPNAETMPQHRQRGDIGGTSHLTPGCSSKGGAGAYAVAATKPVSECNNRQWLGPAPNPLRPARKLTHVVGQEHFLQSMQLPAYEVIPPTASIGGGNGFIQALTNPAPRINGNPRNVEGLLPPTPQTNSTRMTGQRGIFTLSGWQDSLTTSLNLGGSAGSMVGEGGQWYGHHKSAPLARQGSGTNKGAMSMPQLWGSGCTNNESQWQTTQFAPDSKARTKVDKKVYNVGPTKKVGRLGFGVAKSDINSSGCNTNQAPLGAGYGRRNYPAQRRALIGFDNDAKPMATANPRVAASRASRAPYDTT